jgi:hypothetical protein
MCVPFKGRGGATRGSDRSSKTFFTFEKLFFFDKKPRLLPYVSAAGVYAFFLHGTPTRVQLREAVAKMSIKKIQWVKQKRRCNYFIYIFFVTTLCAHTFSSLLHLYIDRKEGEDVHPLAVWGRRLVAVGAIRRLHTYFPVFGHSFSTHKYGTFTILSFKRRKTVLHQPYLLPPAVHVYLASTFPIPHLCRRMRQVGRRTHRRTLCIVCTFGEWSPSVVLAVRRYAVCRRQVGRMGVCGL